MIRLIGIFLGFALFLIFIMLNLDNRSNIHLGFVVFDDVPVYITAFFSIFIGMIVSIPMYAVFIKRKHTPEKNIKPGKKDKNIPKHPEFFDEIPRENGPYGID